MGTTAADPTAAAQGLIATARSLGDLQRWVDDYSRDNLDPLSKAAQRLLREESDLSLAAAKLLTLAGDVLAEAVTQQLPKINSAIADLKNITADLDQVAKVLHVVAAAITVAASIAAAVASGGVSAGTAISAVGDLVEAIDGLKA